jgi:hypothetical protein
LTRNIILTILFFRICVASAQGQSFADGDHWFDNPLGFSPVELHTKNGLLIPALAVSACLLLTGRDSTTGRNYYSFGDGGISFGYKQPRTTLGQVNLGFVYSLRTWMHVGAEVVLTGAHDGYNDALGAGVRPFARFRFLNAPRWNMFFETGAGLIYFFDCFPKPTPFDSRAGTRFNGTTRYGITGEADLSRSMLLILGVHHTHVSNGNTSGIERNPSYDSNGIFLGVAFRPARIQ